MIKAENNTILGKFMNSIKQILGTTLIIYGLLTVSATAVDMKIKRAHCINELVEMPEQTFKAALHKSTLPSTLSIKHDVAGNLSVETAHKKYNCGQFGTLTIGQLQQRCNEKNKLGNGHFNVIEGVNTSNQSTFLAQVDIGALQAHPDNKDAVFQIASNFNGLETTFAEQNIDTQLLGEYIHDKTQGPCASLSAAPGLLLRRYFAFFDQNLLPQEWQQTQAHSINFLDKLPHITVTPAGYVVLDHTTLTHQPTNEDYTNIKIGLHQNIQVTYGRKIDEEYHIRCTDPEQLINQVFTAAIDFGNTNSQWRNNQNAQQWGQMIIKAAYEGTLRTAFAYDKKRVFLTLVGCGVFNNPLVWVSNALNELQSFIKESGLDVTLIWYKSNNDNDEFRQALRTIVIDTDGIYTQYCETKKIK